MRNLTPEDWRVIDFYRFVRDQVVNITPNEEKYDHRPRLESWLAVGRERGLSGSDLLEIVEAARFLHETVQGRCPIPPLEWRLALEEEMRPLPEPMDA